MGDTDNIMVRRERWKDGHYYSVARNEKGHLISWRKWTGVSSTKRTTQRASEIVYEKKTKAEGAIKFSPTREEYERKPKPVSRYEIVVKMTTTTGREWFCVFQSPHKHLTDKDKRYIINNLVPQYQRRSENSIYNEGVGPGGVEPVLTKDLSTGEKVYFA